jgi:KDZ transposase family protein
MLNDSEPPVGWQFGFGITTEQVWDGFVILALLEDCLQRSKVLKVPHTGLQKDRFTAALQRRNLRFRVHGQPESQHYCTKCLRIYKDKKVWVCVIDGVTVGCPCCAVHNCKVPLENNQHRFCPQDSAQNHVCSVVGCSAPTAPDSRMCSDPEHQEAEQIHQDRQQAHFQLKERLQRARVAHPSDAIAQDVNVADLIDADDEEEDLEITGQDSAAKNPRKRIRVQLGRKRTHNEQIIVAPCGMIIAHEMFYGAEGIGSVIVSVDESVYL